MTNRKPNHPIHAFVAVAVTTAILVAATAKANVEFQNFNPALSPNQNNLVQSSNGIGENQRNVETITQTLYAQREITGELACNTGAARIALQVGGMSFGSLLATSNGAAPCLVTFDFTELEGLDDDLADKVFGWSDEAATWEDYIRSSFHNRQNLDATKADGQLKMADFYHNLESYQLEKNGNAKDE